MAKAALLASIRNKLIIYIALQTHFVWFVNGLNQQEEIGKKEVNHVLNFCSSLLNNKCLIFIVFFSLFTIEITLQF